MPRSRQHADTAPSHRSQRVGELIRHAAAELLSRGAVNDPVLEHTIVTVPEVRMSPDLRLATLYVMPLGGKDVAPVLAALERHKKYIRGEIAQRIAMKFAPDIRFRADDSFERGGKIDRLLNSPLVTRDLAKPGKPDGPED